MLRRSALVLPAAVALMIAAGCGGSSGSTTSNSTPKPTPTPTRAAQFQTVDACKLVSETDATTAVGTPMAQAPSGTSGAAQQSLCFFTPKDTSGSSQAFVFVISAVYPDQSTADAVSPDQIAAIYRNQFGVSNAHPVSGIGDKAFEYTATSQSGNGIAILVFKANVLIMIVAGPTGDSAKVEALAKTAVGNLDKAKS